MASSISHSLRSSISPASRFSAPRWSRSPCRKTPPSLRCPAAIRASRCSSQRPSTLCSKTSSAAGPGLWKVYRHCKGAPGEADDRALSAYLRGHVQTPNLHHVGTPYRRVDTVRADLDLRMFLERQADRLAQNGGGQPPGTAWNRLRAAANPPAAGGDLSPNVNAQTGEVTWESRHEPRWRARLRHWGTFIGLFLMAVAAV